MTLDFVANGRWLWFVTEQPSVSQSSVVSSVSQADEVTGNDSSASNDSYASQRTLSTPGDISLASILQAMEARISTRFDSLEGRMATKDDFDISKKKMQNMMHNKIANFATSIQRQLTAFEERLDVRIDNLASDHNQLVSN